MPHPYDNIPPLLKHHPNWVAWGIRGAPPKIPYNPASLLSGNPQPAKAGIPETWGSFHTAAECVKRGLAKGIGYEFDGGDIYGIDLDHVIDAVGVLAPEAQEIVAKLDSFTEVSPSKTGLHIFVLAPGAQITRHRKKGCFIEIYNGGRYFTVTGNIYGNMKSIETRTAELQAIHDKYLLPEATKNLARLPPTQSAEQERFLHIGLSRDKAFAALWGGDRLNKNESADDIALMNKLAYWLTATPDSMIRAFLSSPYYAQKDEAHKKKCQRPDYLPNTAKNACANVYSTAIADYNRWQQGHRQERSSTR